MQIFSRKRRPKADVDAAYKAVFSGQHGLVVLEDLARLCAYSTREYTPGADASVAITECAKRSVFLHILNKTKGQDNDDRD